MKELAPEGPVYQAGTLSGNPLAMVAGLTTLKALQDDPEIYVRLDEKTAHLHHGMHALLEGKGLPFQINRLGSMLSLHFTDQPVTDFDSAAAGNNRILTVIFTPCSTGGVSSSQCV